MNDCKIMEVQMNTVVIKINGIEYNLKGEEREEYLQKVAVYVDTKLKSIMNNNAKLSLSSAAVLTAVNSVDDLFKCDLSYKDLCQDIELSEEKQKSQKDEIESLRKKLKNSEENNNKLQEKIRSIDLPEIYKKHGLEIEKLNKEQEIAIETAQKHISENVKLTSENKELKFQLQSSKYKIINLQNRLVENGVDLAKIKKILNNPLKSK